MKILEIKNIEHEDLPLYYRRKYKGVAVVELPIKKMDVPLDFTIETNPFGNKSFDVELGDRVEYPLLPFLRAVKAFISTMDNEGLLQ